MGYVPVIYVNIPVALIVLAFTGALMPSSPVRSGSVDVLGAVAVTAGLATLVYGVVRAPEAGWGSASTLLAIGGGVVLLAAFALLQARTRSPLVRLAIFRTPNLAGANLAQLLTAAAWIPMWFFLNLYLQQVLGLGAFASGAALLPMTATIMVMMVGLAPRLIARFGPKPLIVTGLSLLAAGMVWLSQVRPHGSYAIDVLPASLVAAAGMALAFIPSLGTAISSARPEEGGLAAGIVNTGYQIGSALGLAVMTAVATAHGSGELGDPDALTNGFSAAFLGAAALAAVGALASLLTVKAAPNAAEPAPDPEVLERTAAS